MNSLRLGLCFSLALLLCACPATQQQLGYHKIPVTWGPGYENVPDCNPLIAMQGKAVSIKGVTVTTPAGIGGGGGEFTREDKALQTASEAAQLADQKYTHLCELLPSYSNDQHAFYDARDQMFALIKGTQSSAATVAALTGQATPAPAPAVPTAATTAATDAGVNPAKGIANLPSTTSPAAAAATPAGTPSSQQINNVLNAANHLKAVAQKKVPTKGKSKKTTKKSTSPQ